MPQIIEFNYDMRANGHYRSMWSAAILHTIIFCLMSTVAMLFRCQAQYRLRLPTSSRANANNDARDNAYTGLEGHETLAGRCADATRIFRDSLLVLVVSVISTGIGYGATAAGSALTWVGVGFSVLASLVAFAVRHPVAPMILLLPAYSAFLVTFGLAFRYTETGTVTLS